MPWKYCFLTVVCGLFLLAGFFAAARQHFLTIEYGIKNSKLRKQIESLEAENRSLINARETALAPTEIIKAAKKLGFTNKAQTLPENSSEKASRSIEKEIVKTKALDKSPEETKSETKEDKKTEIKSKDAIKTESKDKKESNSEKIKNGAAKK